jgi:hypothetical protein
MLDQAVGPPKVWGSMMQTIDRYLRFDNIDMEQPDISSRCSVCGQTFKADPKLGERVDDAPDHAHHAHICSSDHHDQVNTPGASFRPKYLRMFII